MEHAHYVGDVVAATCADEGGRGRWDEAYPAGRLCRARVRRVATREDLHRTVDALSEAELERVRIIFVDRVDEDTSLQSILARHGEHRLETEQFVSHFGDLPQDGEG